MITPELSDFLEHEEKESILKAISASDKVSFSRKKQVEQVSFLRLCHLEYVNILLKMKVDGRNQRLEQLSFYL